jgi:hypothetical protein
MAKTLKEKCLEKGIAYSTVRARIARGWTEKQALNTPPASKPLKVEIPADVERPADPMEKIDAATDGITLTIALMILGFAVVGLLWMLTK